MSQENVEIARKMAEAFNQGGWEAIIDKGILHPEIEYHDDERWPEARSALGTAALAKRFEEIMEVLGNEAEVEVEELLDADRDQVVVIFCFRGQARASGIHHEYRWAYLCRLRGGQIHYIQAYLEPERAVEAAGLRE